MPLPLVSVVIPVFNGERFLKEALESVLAHDYAPLDVVAVDDGSTDASGAILRSYPAVRYEAQHNQGNAAARNRGVAIARGEFIAFIDQDDRWRCGKLRNQIAALGTQQAPGYSLCHCELLLDAGMALPPTYDANYFSKPFPGYLPSALILHRRAFDRVGPFDTSYRYANDTDWISRATDQGVPCAMLNEVYVDKRVHDTNLGHNAPEMRKDIMRMVRSAVERKRRAGSTCL